MDRKNQEGELKGEKERSVRFWGRGWRRREILKEEKKKNKDKQTWGRERKCRKGDRKEKEKEGMNA